MSDVQSVTVDPATTAAGRDGGAVRCEPERRAERRHDSPAPRTGLASNLSSSAPALVPAHTAPLVPAHAPVLVPRPAIATPVAGDEEVGLEEADDERDNQLAARGMTAIPRLPPAGAGTRVQRTSLPELFVAIVTPDRDEAGGLLVEDGAETLTSGQMRKGEFMRQLRTEVCRVAEEELRRAGRSAAGCPYIDQMLSYYEGRSAEHLERAIRRYAPETQRVRNALDYLPVLSARLGRGIARWATTGQMPEDVPNEALAALAGARNGLVGAIAGIAGLSRKAPPGAEPATVDAGALVRRLGPGQALDGGTQARMERALGHSFAGVRIHADDRAAALSHDLAARAFTIGPHVAFGAGELRPGTLHGDALLAHELAHVVQQGTAAPHGDVPLGGASDPLEHDADLAAAAALEQLHGDEAPRPRRSWARAAGGLRLQRCGGQQAAVAAAVPPRTTESFVDTVPLTHEEALARRDELIRSHPIPSTTVAPAPSGAAGGSLRDQLTTLLQAQQLQPAQSDAAWQGTQRAMATAWGQAYVELTTAQRDVTEMLSIGDQLQPDEVQPLRSHALSYAYARFEEIRSTLIDRAVMGTMTAIRTASPGVEGTVEARVRAAIAGSLAVEPLDLNQLGVALRALQSGQATPQTLPLLARGFHISSMNSFRERLGRAVAIAAGTAMRGFYTADDSGLHQEMLTASDYQSRVASAPSTTAAGHLRFTSANPALTQQMMEQIYQIQATSPIAFRLVQHLVVGASRGRTQRRDVNIEAVTPQVPLVIFDTFSTNQVDPQDVTTAAQSTVDDHPTSAGGATVHYLAERQSDAMTNPQPLGDLETLARQVQADAEAIIARGDCPSELRAALLTAPHVEGRTVGEVIFAHADYTERIRPGFETRLSRFLQLNDARIAAPHDDGLQVECAYYREQGIQSRRCPVSS